jgi:hypothetical protein
MELIYDRPVLSPVFNKNDKSFVSNLNNFIDEELLLIDSSNKNNNIILKEKYLIFKQAFNKVITMMNFFIFLFYHLIIFLFFIYFIIKIISYVQVYKSLLTNIKKEYEYCIDELERSQQEVDNAQDEIAKLECSTQTLHILELRKAELNKM